jgi:hypothetical protein
MEKIGKLCFNREDFLGRGRYGTVFRGTLEGVLNVAIKRVEKRFTQVESHFLLKADGHPNVIRYFSTEESDIEFTYGILNLTFNLFFVQVNILLCIHIQVLSD